MCPPAKCSSIALCIISFIFMVALIDGMRQTPSSPFSLNNTPSDVHLAMARWNRDHISKLPQQVVWSKNKILAKGT